MRTAVLVINLQVGLFKEKGNPFDFRNTIEKISTLTRSARQKKLARAIYPIMM